MDISSVNLKDKEKFIPWFRNNYFQLKTNPKFKELFLIYYNFMTAEERKLDLFIENYILYKKNEEYKIYLKSNEKYHKTIAGQFVCVRNGIFNSTEMCKNKYKSQVKSIKNAFSATLATVNQKAIDLNSTEIKTSIGYFETELSLILDDKWIIDFSNEYKKFMLNSLNKVLLKNLDKNDVSEVKVHINKIQEEENVNKSKLNASNSINDKFFKTPETLPPKSKRNSSNASSSIINSFSQDDKNVNTSIKNSLPLATCSSQENSLEIPELQNVIQKIENVSLKNSDNDSMKEKSIKEHSVPDSKDSNNIKNNLRSDNKVSKESNLSNILEVSESSTDSHKSFENIINSQSTIQGPDKHDRYKCENKVIDNSTKNIGIIQLEINNSNKNYFDSTMDISSFINHRPVAESTKRVNSKIVLEKVDKKINEIENFDDDLTINGIKNYQPVAESTKKPDSDKLKQTKNNDTFDDIDSVRNFMDHPPNAESTKKLLLNNTKNMMEVQSIDENLTVKGFFAHPPAAESTKKINMEIKINHCKEINSLDDFTIKGFMDRPPAAESTKKINVKETKEKIFVDNNFTIKGFINHRPAAESTKKINPTDDFTIKGFMDLPPAAESTKKVKVNETRNKEVYLQNELSILDKKDINSMDNICTIKGFINHPPVAESTKIDKTKLETDQYFEEHKKSSRNNLGNAGINKEAITIDTNNIATEEIDFEDPLTFRKFKKFGPVAQSTKKTSFTEELSHSNPIKDKSRNKQIPKLMQFSQIKTISEISLNNDNKNSTINNKENLIPICSQIPQYSKGTNHYSPSKN